MSSSSISFIPNKKHCNDSRLLNSSVREDQVTKNLENYRKPCKKGVKKVFGECESRVSSSLLQAVSVSSEGCLSTIPEDLFGVVFSFMELKEALVTVCCINHKFRDLYKDNTFVQRYSSKEVSLKGRPLINDAVKRLLTLPIQNLNLSWGNVTDKSFSRLSELSLLSLDLSQTNISDQSLSNLSKMPLEELRLFGCQLITDAGLVNLKDKPLRLLDIGGCVHVSDEGASSLKGLPLEVLYLCDSSITDEGVKEISLLALKTLGLSFTDISDISLSHIRKMPLENLDLSNTEITDRGLEFLSGMPLKVLNINNCQGCTSSGIEALKRSNPILKFGRI